VGHSGDNSVVEAAGGSVLNEARGTPGMYSSIVTNGPRVLALYNVSKVSCEPIHLPRPQHNRYLSSTYPISTICSTAAPHRYTAGCCP
jgi:hypothetical protein